MSELPINQVVTGDCREVMSEWSPECIDFVMFSPPYWGLRDYGEGAESVWGGDEDCDHMWRKEDGLSMGGGTNGNTGQHSDNHTHFDSKSKFCSKCGAWRGQLGLEPDYRMYVQHLVEVGRAIKRILKPSGSWWLNLGDTYAGSNTGHTGPSPSKWENLPRSGGKSLQSRIDIPAKCQMAMPERVMLALIDDGWIRRNATIWLKPNPMPSSVKDRLNTTYEFVYHFVKRKKYYYDLDAIREPWKDKRKHDIDRAKTGHEGYNGKHKTGKLGQGIKGQPVGNPSKGKNPGDVIKTRGYRTKEGEPHSRISGREQHHGKNINYSPKGKNPGDVIELATQPFPEAHFAVYPPDLCELPIKSSCPKKTCAECDTDTKPGIVLDPMCGAGSTLVKAKQLGRNYIGIEISDEYADIARERLKKGDKEYKKRKRKERRLEKQAEETANLEEFM